MYETTIKGFKIRLTNSLRDGLLKEWDPKKVTPHWKDGHVLMKEKCVLCDYSEEHSGSRCCEKCPIFKFEYAGDDGCGAIFQYLLGSRADLSLGRISVTFQHTLKTSRRYVQKIRDTILAMKKV